MSHKFGPDKEKRIIPVVKLDDPTIDALTERHGPVEIIVEATRVTKQRTVVAISQDEQANTASRKDFVDKVQDVRKTLKERATEIELHEGTGAQRLDRMESYLADTMMYTRRILKETFGE